MVYIQTFTLKNAGLFSTQLWVIYNLTDTTQVFLSVLFLLESFLLFSTLLLQLNGKKVHSLTLSHINNLKIIKGFLNRKM